MSKQVEYIRIVDEIATGAVNGINKVFVLARSASLIESITVNSVAYGQYGFSGTTITLDDAPTSGTVEVTYTYINGVDYNDVASWITMETLDGIVDGTNRLFTTFYPISFIDEVRVDSIVTTAYITLGNAILLNSAPSTGTVVIDYFRKDFGVIDTQRDEYYTKKEVRDLIYTSISQDDTSTQYPIALVDTAISTAVGNVDMYIKDRSRNISFTIQNGDNQLSTIVDSISTVNIAHTEPIPNGGRMILENGDMLDYSLVNDQTVTLSGYSRFPLPNDGNNSQTYIGYRLPRNINRVLSVYDNQPLTDSGNISGFLFGGNNYLISGGFLFIKNEGEVTIEIELRTKSDSDDSIIFIEKDDIAVIIDGALARLYRERESEKYPLAMQASIEAIKDYKRTIRMRRSKDGNQVMKTVPFGSPSQQFKRERIKTRTVTRTLTGDLDGGSAVG